MNDIKQYDSDINYVNSGDIIADAKLIIDSAQATAHYAINFTLIRRNWLLGRRIVEEELGNASRSELYGRKVVPMLAKELTKEYGKGYTRRSLYQYAQFYRMFPEIVQTASAQSIPRLNWSHYVELLRVKDDRTSCTSPTRTSCARKSKRRSACSRRSTAKQSRNSIREFDYEEIPDMRPFQAASGLNEPLATKAA